MLKKNLQIKDSTWFWFYKYKFQVIFFVAVFFFVLNHFTNHWDASMIDWFSCYYTYMTVRSVCVFVHERETEVFNVDILYRHDWN